MELRTCFANESRIERFKGEREVIQDLSDLKQQMDEANIEFWLMSGTLLGCVNMGHIIPGDEDIDLGMWIRERSKFTAIMPQLKSLGFSVWELYDPGRERVQGLVTIKRSGMRIHLKMFEEIGGYAVMGIARNASGVSRVLRGIADLIYYEELPPRLRKTSSNHIVLSLVKALPRFVSQRILKTTCVLWRRSGAQYGIVAIPAKYFRDLCQTQFYCMSFRIPAESQSYLREEYGDKWMENDPHGKGGLEKISHILLSELNNSDLDDERRRRLRATGYHSSVRGK